MKPLIFLFCVFLLAGSVKSQPTGTYYSKYFYTSVGNEYTFYLHTFFSFGSGSICPRVKFVHTERSNDTVYIKALYNENGVWPALGCSSHDTIHYTNAYTDIHYFNISTNVYRYDEEFTPPVNDTTWNLQDTTFVLEISGIIGIPMLESSFGLYPNPVSSVLHIANQSGLPIRSWSVSDMSGKEVLQGKSVERVDVQMLGSGLYWINILLEDGRRAHLKWMKQ